MQKKSAVIGFIEEQRAKGIDDKEIQHQLLNSGWHMDIVQHAMQAIHGDKSSSPAVDRPKKIKSELINPQKPYVWVVLFIVLIMTAIFI